MFCHDSCLFWRPTIAAKSHLDWGAIQDECHPNMRHVSWCDLELWPDSCWFWGRGHDPQNVLAFQPYHVWIDACCLFIHLFLTTFLSTLTCSYSIKCNGGNELGICAFLCVSTVCQSFYYLRSEALWWHHWMHGRLNPGVFFLHIGRYRKCTLPLP